MAFSITTVRIEYSYAECNNRVCHFPIVMLCVVVLYAVMVTVVMLIVVILTAIMAIIVMLHVIKLVMMNVVILTAFKLIGVASMIYIKVQNDTMEPLLKGKAQYN
jgi:hypothetical protein